MDKVKIVTVSQGKDVKEKSFISINGKELNRHIRCACFWTIEE